MKLVMQIVIESIAPTIVFCDCHPSQSADTFLILLILR